MDDEAKTPLQQTFVLTIHPNPYDDERVDRDLHACCDRMTRHKMIISTVFRGWFTRSESDLHQHMRSWTWKALAKIRYHVRPEWVLFALRHNWIPFDPNAPWRQWGDISTTSWILE